MVRLDKKKRKDKYQINVYGIEVHVLINYTDTDVKSEYVKYNNEPIDDDLADSMNAKGMQWGVIRDKETKARVCIININTTKAESILDLINSCAHEALHTAVSITDFTEIRLDRCSEEAYAYLTGYITECVYKTLFKL